VRAKVLREGSRFSFESAFFVLYVEGFFPEDCLVLNNVLVS